MADSRFKTMMNSLSSESDVLRELSEREVRLLKEELLLMFLDVQSVCQKHGLSIMLGGGSALGCVRHQGFIPWDDDLDLLMPRSDFEVFKNVFEEELGGKYILSAPNYQGKAKARFPKVMKKNTVLKELTDINSNLPCGVFLDIFLIESVPDHKLIQRAKGLWCNALMYASTQAYWYEHKCEQMKNYMSQTKASRRAFRLKMTVGRVCSIIPSWKWFNVLDKALQYHGKTNTVGLPTGRKHYFGEIHLRDTLLPVSYGSFCDYTVPMPGKPDVYLSKLYGSNYMELPPESKREKHFIVEFALGDSRNG